MPLHRGDRHDPMMRVLKMASCLLRLHAPGALHQDAGNDLQAVGDPMLHLLQQDRLFPDELVLVPRFGANVGHVGDRQQQPDVLAVAILQPAGIDDEVPGELTGPGKVWLQSLPPDQVPACGPPLEHLMKIMPWRDALAFVLKGEGNCAVIAGQWLGISLPGWTLAGFAMLMLWAVYCALPVRYKNF